jgi:hypothetical protein
MAFRNDMSADGSAHLGIYNKQKLRPFSSPLLSAERPPLGGNLMVTFADRGVSRGQLGDSNSSICILMRLSGPRYKTNITQKIW